jgi:hypothetical protein
VWTVLGTAGLSFLVDNHGLRILGDGEQDCGPSTGTAVDLSKIEKLPARWTVFRAAEAGDLADLLSLDVSEMKRYLDAGAVKGTTDPIAVISYCDKVDHANPAHVAFSVFLPDRYFRNVWQLAKLITRHPDMRYWLRFDFRSFLPRKVPEHPDLLSYEL